MMKLVKYNQKHGLALVQEKNGKYNIGWYLPPDGLVLMDGEAVMNRKEAELIFDLEIAWHDAEEELLAMDEPEDTETEFLLDLWEDS